MQQEELPPSVHLIEQTNQIKTLFTIIRDRETKRKDFVFYSDRLFRLLIEKGLGMLPFQQHNVITPTNAEYQGYSFCEQLCGVSIIRAGESMEAALRQVCQNIRIGKILIQRDEETAQPKLFYTKLPHDIAKRRVLLLDPMLATAGSALCAVAELLKVGVKEENIIAIFLLGAPVGIKLFTSTYPKITIVMGEVDAYLNDQKFIVPGLGDFGDRYFGTTD